MALTQAHTWQTVSLARVARPTAATEAMIVVRVKHVQLTNTRDTKAEV